MKETLAKIFGKYLFGPKTPFHWKKCFSWRLGQFSRCFEWKYRAVSENVFSMSVIYLHFSHCKFSLFYFLFIELGSKLDLQRAQFWSWLPEQQNPQNLRAWYKVHLLPTVVSLHTNSQIGPFLQTFFLNHQ